MARYQLIENDILRKMIGTLQITNTPTNTILLITHENGLITTRTTLGTKLGRYRNKALAPPYAKVREIRLGTMVTLIRRDISRQDGGWKTIAKISRCRQGITPERERET